VPSRRHGVRRLATPNDGRGENLTDRRLLNEARALAICRAAFDKLEADDGTLRADALALIELWDRKQTCSPLYSNRWRELLDMPLDAARAIVLAPTDEGQALRAASPFPGFFTHAERRSFHRTSSK
jgi:hypothetical protein